MELLKFLLITEPRWPLSRNLSNGPVLRRTKSSLLRLAVFHVYVQLRFSSRRISVLTGYYYHLTASFPGQPG